MEKEYTDEQYDEEYKLKQKGLENILGRMHDMVGHSVTPFYMGGSVDLYYFLNHINGTGFATMELLDLEGNGPLPSELGTYELVAFTKEPYNDKNPNFKIMSKRIQQHLTAIGAYSYESIFKPGETYESQFGDNNETRYLIFDNYSPNDKKFMVGERQHYLLLVMEIFKSEMEFSWDYGSEALFEILKEAGHYPYSDLDRESVV